MIETDRLILRPEVEADVENLHALWSDPAVVQFIGATTSTREQSWQRLLRGAGSWALKGCGPFAIIEKHGGRFLGHTGHTYGRRGLGEAFDPFPEAGWVLARWAHGQGYATEAVAAAHVWFDQARPEIRCVCIVDPANAGSLRVAGKIGYRPFGRATYAGDEVIMLERHKPGHRYD